MSAEHDQAYGELKTPKADFQMRPWSHPPKGNYLGQRDCHGECASRQRRGDDKADDGASPAVSRPAPW